MLLPVSGWDLSRQERRAVHTERPRPAPPPRWVTHHGTWVTALLHFRGNGNSIVQCERCQRPRSQGTLS
ncbi:hypothetical protein JG687_00016615 [Phytophthora cactorum]|uniref:Uncharacterized protein n=1 Tax=Phytophthora cactorum TaxID=29920 RepID=A0A8T1TRM3_9STRA|nr:hypothetical protein JG687_00016615 [Phytophthora cactorum]